MADLVTTQILENGFRRLVMKFTNLSDGTGEAAVKKVDATSNTFAVLGQPPGVHLKIVDVDYDLQNMSVRLLWDASTPTDIMILSQNSMSMGKALDQRGGFQGFINPQAAGATGSILLTTVGAAANSSYTIILSMTKGVPQ